MTDNGRSVKIIEFVHAALAGFEVSWKQPMKR
jgi:hypothetical protein